MMNKLWIVYTVHEFWAKYNQRRHPEQRALASVVEGPSTNERTQSSLYKEKAKEKATPSHMRWILRRRSLKLAAQDDSKKKLRAISYRIFFLLLLPCFLSRCTSTPEKPQPKIRLIQVSHHQLPGWHQDDFREALKAMKKSCKTLIKKPDSKDLGLMGRAADWKPICSAILKIDTHQDIKKLLEDHFHAYKIHDDCGSGSFCTGYYEPHLKGSFKKSKKYHHPLYKKPKDLREENGKVIPYASRKQIDSGHLAGQDLELLWVDCPIDAFFLEIQGSGQVILDDGRVIRIGYDGKNGYPYTPIGRILIERGALTKEAVSMQSIRKWLHDNPHHARELMHQNESHVFFRLIDGEGPMGSQGVALTPERSLAVDPTHIPLGALLWIDLTHPLEFGRLQQLVVAQDTGGAIKGPLRGDLFWGAGELAAHMAGHMKSNGDFYILLPKSVVVSG